MKSFISFLKSYIKQRLVNVINASKISKGSKISRFDLQAINNFLFNQNKTKPNQKKIKIYFLFQFPSFWPSIESFWNECSNDDSIDNKMILFFTDQLREKTQMAGSKNFLNEIRIPFVEFNQIQLDQPDVLVIQSPYDEGHRPRKIHSDLLRAQGIRIVYITYGIEISDTPQSKSLHFNRKLIDNAWRVFTFSKYMLPDYRKNSFFNEVEKFQSLGHPKFDYLATKNKFPFYSDVEKRIKNKFVVLWKLHFPKFFDNAEVTPRFSEYIKLINYIKKQSNIFFIIMPHPKYFEVCQDLNLLENEILLNELEQYDNVFMDFNHDYRPSFLRADSFIIDRSALMVEAGLLSKPVFYVYNNDFDEPLTEPVKKIIDSYEKGSSFNEIEKFIELSIADKDLKKSERELAVKDVIGSEFGNAGRDIKDHIKEALLNEK